MNGGSAQLADAAMAAGAAAGEEKKLDDGVQPSSFDFDNFDANANN